MKRRAFKRGGRRRTGRRVLLVVLATVVALVAVAGTAMALRGREIAERIIPIVAAQAGIGPDQLEVRRIGFRGIELGAVRVGGAEGLSAAAIEIGWTPLSLLSGRVGRIRIENLVANATIENGNLVIAGLPRSEGEGGMPALPAEQIDLAGAKLTLTAGAVQTKATMDAAIVPREGGAIVGRAAIDAVVEAAGQPAIRAIVDMPEWRLTRDGAGLQFAVVAASLAVPDYDISVSAVEARFDSGPQPSFQATAAIRDEAEPPRIVPLAVAAQGRVEQEELTFTGRAGTSEGAIAATFDGRHALSSGKGTMKVAVAPIRFAADGRQPRDPFPIAGDVARRVEGAVRADGLVSWGGTVSSNGTLALDHIGFETGVARVSDLSGTIRLSSLLPPRTASAQRITANVHAAGLPPMPLDLRFGLSGDYQTTINAATLGFAGGTLGVADVVLAAGKPVDAVLSIQGVDLGAVLTLLDIDGLSGSGTINGTVPIRVDANGAALRSGELIGTVPGVMRYTGTALPEPAADASATDPIRLMRAALADFHYSELRLTLERAMSGEGSLLVNLKGANPQVLDNHPFVFNIRLDANFDKLAAILFEGYAAAEELMRRHRRP